MEDEQSVFSRILIVFLGLSADVLDVIMLPKTLFFSRLKKDPQTKPVSLTI